MSYLKWFNPLLTKLEYYTMPTNHCSHSIVLDQLISLSLNLNSIIL